MFIPYYPNRRILRNIWICLFAVAITACGTLEVGVERPPITDERIQKTISAMQSQNSNLATQAVALASTLTPSQTSIVETSLPTPPPTTSQPVTLTPAFTKTPSPPLFSSLYFSTQPDGPPQFIFVEGIQRVYAIWEYKNMNIGMIVRRLWEKDDEIWAERFETWDIPRYGAEGIKRDTIIYDFDYGLQRGRYTLTLNINGVTQKFKDGEASRESMGFWVVPSEITGAITSPNKTYSIFILWGGRLTVEDPDGNFRDLVVTNEISFIEWFPDSRHIVYADRDRTKQEDRNSDIGMKHQLWILDVVTGEREMIGSAEENFHHPVVSPDGRHIAVLSGSTYRDACLASPQLEIIRLSETYQRESVYKISNFSGIPYTGRDDISIFPINPNRPGSWQDEYIFVATLEWTCIQDSEKTDGVYLLNLEKMQAEHLDN